MFRKCTSVPFGFVLLLKLLDLALISNCTWLITPMSVYSSLLMFVDIWFVDLYHCLKACHDWPQEVKGQVTRPCMTRVVWSPLSVSAAKKHQGLYICILLSLSHTLIHTRKHTDIQTMPTPEQSATRTHTVRQCSLHYDYQNLPVTCIFTCTCPLSLIWSHIPWPHKLKV